MENRFKLSISKMFRSSFNSCKTQTLFSDVITQPSQTPSENQTPIFTVQGNPHLEFLQEESPNDPLLPSFPKSLSIKSAANYYNNNPLIINCKPRCPETFDEMVRENCIIAKDSFLTRKKIYSSDDIDVGRRCPPASPISPLNQYFKLYDCNANSNGNEWDKERKMTRKKSTKSTKIKNGTKPRTAQLGKLMKEPIPSHLRSSSHGEEDWFSSDDEREDETETLFSSKSVSFNSFSSKSFSFSSDSDSVPRSGHIRNRRNKGGSRSRRRRGRGEKKMKKKTTSGESEQVGVMPLQEKVKGSFAVVKSSSDPFNDFRTSMVEMIIEKQIFGAKELEDLLQCFLSLNSAHHHRVIVQVFTEIWEALFDNGS